MDPVAPLGDLALRLPDEAVANRRSTRPAPGAAAVALRFARFAEISGWTSVGVGFLTLFGWIIHWQVLTSFIPSGNTMKPNTAVAFVLAGVALAFQATGIRVRASRLAGALVAVIGGLTLLEYLSGQELGIDRVLFPHAYAGAAVATAGRMSPSTAVAFLLLGTALVLRRERNRVATRVTELLSVVVVFVGFMAALGYAFGAPALYRLAVYTSMALPTALLFLALGLGVMAARPQQGMMVLLTADSAGGALVRRLVPTAVAVEIIVGGLSLTLQRRGLYDSSFGLAIVVAGAGIVIAAAAWNIAMRLQVLDADRADILANLERRVATRTAELAEATQLFQSAFEDAPIGFVLSALDGTYQRVNKAMCAITGYPEAELVGRTGEHLTHPDDYSRDLAGIIGIQDGSTPKFLNEKRFVRADGEVIWASIHASLLPGPDGHAEHIIAQVVDVTDRHRAEEGLSAANDELRHANDIKDHFVAVTTHELRSPLTTIVGFTELLRESWDDVSEPDRIDYIGRIERQGRRLEGLVADLLTLSTIDAGGLHVDTSPVVVLAALEEAVAASGGVASTTCAPGLVVSADPDRLQQILVNLLTNARKYGAEPVTVAAVEVDELRIRIEIRDRGAGVPEEFVPYLFETFTQAGTGRTRRTTGSGLGLAIVSRLAVAQHGEVFYEPNPGGGSCFGVVLDAASVGQVPQSTLAHIGVAHGS